MDILEIVRLVIGSLLGQVCFRFGSIYFRTDKIVFNLKEMNKYPHELTNRWKT
jgi:hypothetical protein